MSNGNLFQSAVVHACEKGELVHTKTKPLLSTKPSACYMALATRFSIASRKEGKGLRGGEATMDSQMRYLAASLVTDKQTDRHTERLP